MTNERDSTKVVFAYANTRQDLVRLCLGLLQYSTLSSDSRRTLTAEAVVRRRPVAEEKQASLMGHSLILRRSLISEATSEPTSEGTLRLDFRGVRRGDTDFREDETDEGAAKQNSLARLSEFAKSLSSCEFQAFGDVASCRLVRSCLCFFQRLF